MIIIIFLTILALFSFLIIDSFYSESHSESCGHVFNVPTNTHYDNSHCRDPSYELVCENNRSVLYVNYGRHLVHAIYASNSSTSILQSVTAGIDNTNCSAIIHHSLTYSNFSHAFTDEKYHYYGGELLFVSCENPVHSPSYVESMAACASEAPKSLYSYVLTGYPIIVSDVEESVAFSCIQLSPSDRPSMSRVVEMLQGDVDASEILQLEPDLQCLMANFEMYGSVQFATW